ncbi:ketopantoate reductase family protein [Aquabacterium sp. OR-4]|uniref:ketopantoate reductase family protein n=1 Tax=Aquabacterium sp. OR-4 TaxID=2978127 RepID=UPI0028C9E99A|nr:ketopantoate reductase family protein [Aquabacterium sp. OR-4]MDT7839038.1 ketopantoate reductase family protein [Aquabacterium sp. OR-4]
MNDTPNDKPGPWRVMVAGAGAIGCLLAARLAAAGHAVDLLARGRGAQALREHGITLHDLDGTWRVTAGHHSAGLRVLHTPLSAAPEGGPPDLLLLCSKSQDLLALAEAVAPAIGPHTLVLPLVNGVPFWFFHGQGGRFDGRAVQAVDPGGRLLRLLPLPQLLGAVVFITAECTSPGQVQARNPHLLMLGEPAGGLSPRLARVAAMLEAAGIATRPLERIRDKLWTKLVANLTSNPLSVVTRTTLHTIYSDPVLLDTVRAVMHEALLVAAAHGARLEIDPIEFVQLGAAMGAVRTSMLQDFERGRPLELAAIGEAVVELAGLYQLPMPATRTLLSQAAWHAQRRLADAA